MTVERGEGEVPFLYAVDDRYGQRDRTSNAMTMKTCV